MRTLKREANAYVEQHHRVISAPTASGRSKTMLRITIEVDGIPAGMELAVKEDLSYKLEEWYGKTVRVVKVEGVEK